MELDQVAAICKALGDPHRIRIMAMLVNGERYATQLLKEFSISQPTLSHHMKALTDCGLLQEIRMGKRIYYRIDQEVWTGFMGMLGTISNPGYWSEETLSQLSTPTPRRKAPGTK